MSKYAERENAKALGRKVSPGRRETAGQAFERNRTEALRRLKLIEDAVRAAGRGKEVDWGHAGSMAEVVNQLAGAGHYAGVPELTEE